MIQFNENEKYWVLFFLQIQMMSLEEQLVASPQDEVLIIALEMVRRLVNRFSSQNEAGTEEWKNEILPINLNKFSLN